MNAVNEVMQDLGLVGVLHGTVEEAPVLSKLEELNANFKDHTDLFIEAADAVRSARSAGHETIDSNSVFAARRADVKIQLRYRGEMVDVFNDLMIDLALRGALMQEVQQDVVEPEAATPSGATRT